jgi:phosphatidylglycerol:prolipoprotein diacylglycerol transferase
VVAVVVVLPRLFPGGLPVRGYGLMLVAAGLVGITMATYRARQIGVDGDAVVSLAMWLFVAGILGARVFFVIEHWETVFAGLPLGRALVEAVNFTSGGLVVYGAVIGAGIAFVVFCRRYNIDLLKFADVLAPALMAGLALGRIGCLLHGCCFGGPCDLPWAVTFPQYRAGDEMTPPFSDQLVRGELHGVRLEESGEQLVVVRVAPSLESQLPRLAAGAVVVAVDGQPVDSIDDVAPLLARAYADEQPLQLTMDDGSAIALPAAQLRDRSLPIHPTQVYSSINAALMSAFLWFAYRLPHRDGVIVGLMLTLYPIARFMLESIRTDETSFMGTGFSISQNISLLILMLMPIYWIWLFRTRAVRT